MVQGKKFKQQKNRYEIVKTWLSSFVVTVVAVVAAVTLIPKSPIARIIKYTVLLNEITYQVQVTDEDYALEEDSLVVILENQMERYEVPITLGETSGLFENLQANTEYRLSIYGSKGFGLERLDSVNVKTKDNIGGFILGYHQLNDLQEPSYEVDVYINDPNGLYTEVFLYYGYTYDQEPFYQSIPITQARESLEIMHVFAKTHLYLEATTPEGPIILDEMWISPPFQLNSSMYLDFVDSQEIGYVLYHASDQQIDVIYQLDLYENGIKRMSQTIYSSELEGYQHNVLFEGLKKQTKYTMITTARYFNPDTKQEESMIIFEEDIVTLSDYEITYEIIDYVTYLEVNITLIDPSHLFQIPYVEVYDVQGEYPVWISSESFTFIPSVNSKSVSFSIIIPDSNHYRIVIGVRNEIQFIMRHIIYDEITHKE